MPRKATKSLQRRLNPDRRYQSVLVARLINKSMYDGKKHIAEKAVYSA
ncbi:MAG TPA: 30S ribosomal protein S7, partial [Candidatus Saccharimonadales bacterium]|nr:30S ribosomal protein S7 [Candidatus Saccharimonadales bacterium]